MHARQKIRAKLKELLQAHPLLASVYAGRVQPTSSAKFPMANIATGNETSERHSDQWSELRTVTVYIRLYASVEEHISDALDSLSEVTESLLSLDQTLGGVAESFEYKGSEPDAESAANVEVGSLTLEYACKYVWAPNPAVDDLAGLSVSIDMASPRNDPPTPTGPDGQIDAVALIQMPS